MESTFFSTRKRQQHKNTAHKHIGFKTRRSALYVADLKPFEDDLAKLLENVKFRNVNDEFIKTLEKDEENQQFKECFYLHRQNKKHIRNGS